jgi:hypothetical protein
MVVFCALTFACASSSPAGDGVSYVEQQQTAIRRDGEEGGGQIPADDVVILAEQHGETVKCLGDALLWDALETARIRGRDEKHNRESDAFPTRAVGWCCDGVVQVHRVDERCV